MTPGSPSCCWSLCAGSGLPGTATSGPRPSQPGPLGSHCPGGHSRTFSGRMKLFPPPKFILRVPSPPSGRKAMARDREQAWSGGCSVPEVRPGDTWNPEGCGEGTEAGQHRWSQGWELGAGWCWDPAGSQLGPGQLPGGPAWGEFAGAQPAAASPAWGRCAAPQPAASARPCHPSPVWAWGHPSRAPLHRWGPRPPSVGSSHPGPERRNRLRHLPVSGGGGRRGPRCQMEPAPRCNISGR